MPTTLFFDLDDTLWDDDASLQACVMQVCEGLVEHLPPFDALALTRDYIERSDAYWRSKRWDVELLPDARLKLWAETLTLFGCDDQAVARQTRDAYTAYRQAHAVCYEETYEVVGSLHERYRLAAITNGHGEVQRARLQVAGLDRFFSAVVSATDIELVKPSAAMFDHAMKLVGAAPLDTWHIGDSLGSDVAGAHNAGLAGAIWLNRRGHSRADTDPEPHHEVRSLREFAELLERYGS
jgi:HAD superfamily hydrolase (TIGR01549 family)